MPQFQDVSTGLPQTSMLHHLRFKNDCSDCSKSSEVCQRSLQPQWSSFALWFSVFFALWRPAPVIRCSWTRFRRSMWTNRIGGVLQFSWGLNLTFFFILDKLQIDFVILPRGKSRANAAPGFDLDQWVTVLKCAFRTQSFPAHCICMECHPPEPKRFVGFL